MAWAGRWSQKGNIKAVVSVLIVPQSSAHSLTGPTSSAQQLLVSGVGHGSFLSVQKVLLDCTGVRANPHVQLPCPTSQT